MVLVVLARGSSEGERTRGLLYLLQFGNLPPLLLLTSECLLGDRPHLTISAGHVTQLYFDSPRPGRQDRWGGCFRITSRREFRTSRGLHGAGSDRRAGAAHGGADEDRSEKEICTFCRSQVPGRQRPHSARGGRHHQESLSLLPVGQW